MKLNAKNASIIGACLIGTAAVYEGITISMKAKEQERQQSTQLEDRVNVIGVDKPVTLAEVPDVATRIADGLSATIADYKTFVEGNVENFDATIDSIHDSWPGSDQRLGGPWGCRYSERLNAFESTEERLNEVRALYITTIITFIDDMSAKYEDIKLQIVTKEEYDAILAQQNEQNGN